MRAFFFMLVCSFLLDITTRCLYALDSANTVPEPDPVLLVLAGIALLSARWVVFRVATLLRARGARQ